MNTDKASFDEQSQTAERDNAGRVVLASDYYLNNFSELVRFVSSIYADVLSDDELAWYGVFEALPENAKRLYIRLLCRTKSLFRRSRLDYPEIEQLTSAAVILSECGFLDINPSLCSEDLITLFKREELLKLLQLSLPKSTRRADLDVHILETFDNVDVIRLLTKSDDIYEVLRQDDFTVFRLCFFGNLYQDMTDFVLRDLGLTRYENYPINSSTRAFGSRQQLIRHLDYFRCADESQTAIELGVEAIQELFDRLQESAMSRDHGDPVLARRCDRLVSRLARQLERIGELDSALVMYEAALRPPSRERQARIFFKQGRAERALALCQEILANSHSEEELEFAKQFGRRVAKSIDQDWMTLERFTPARIELELQQLPQSVELTAATYFESSGVCYYTENSLFNGVFGLAFWSVIFAPIEGVFFNPFQTAPADFYEPDFHTARQSLIDERFSELTSQSDLESLVWSNWEQKFGIQNPLVNWRYLTGELLDIAMNRISLIDWLAIFRRQISDLRQNRNGFPDLIVFPHTGGYQLVEVKGPGDTLQKNQLRWMRYFEQHDIPCCVAHVSWSESADAVVDTIS